MDETTSRVEHVLGFIAPLIGALGALWAAGKYILTPAYKIAQSEERAKQYKATAEAYKTRVDEMLDHIEKLTYEVKEQTKRSDMLILYIGDRLIWERKGRIGKPPILPPEIEAAIYDMRIQAPEQEPLLDHPAMG